MEQALQRQRGSGRGQAGTPRRPLQRDRSRAVQGLVLSPQAGTAGRTPLPAKVGRDRGVGIRASEACRRCAGRSAHHDRPSWQAQCELQAIGAAVSRPVRVGVHPARAWPRRRSRLARPPLALKRPDQGARRRTAQACWSRASCAQHLALGLRKNPSFTPPGGTFLLWLDMSLPTTSGEEPFLLWLDMSLPTTSGEEPTMDNRTTALGATVLTIATASIPSPDKGRNDSAPPHHS